MVPFLTPTYLRSRWMLASRCSRLDPVGLRYQSAMTGALGGPQPTTDTHYHPLTSRLRRIKQKKSYQG